MIGGWTEAEPIIFKKEISSLRFADCEWLIEKDLVLSKKAKEIEVQLI